MAEGDEGVLPPWSGTAAATGIGSAIRIPVPGTSDLAIELDTRDPRWRGRSTSSIFIQDPSGRRVLRLDFGENPRTGTRDYHWNQKGTFREFGIPDHALAGRGGAVLYGAARVYRYLGRSMVVVGLLADGFSIVTASNRLRRSTQVVSAWATAWLAANVAGRAGAAIGTVIEPGGGTAVGGLVFAFVGGAVGYFAGERASVVVYDWAADTVFHRWSQEQLPSSAVLPMIQGGLGVP